MGYESNVFPSFLRLEYQESGALPAFQKAVDSAFSTAETRAARFASSFSEIDRVITDALATPRNNAGALDLGVPQMQAAAAAAEARAIAAREVATATRLAAEAESDYSQRARLAIAASEALANEEEQAAIAARSHAVAVEQVQTQLDRQKSATDHLTEADGRLGRGMGANRQAYIGAGQQLQDIIISIKGGQQASLVFAQQLPQLAFALSNLGIQADGTQKGIGRFATLLSGPYSIALVFASAAVGGLVGKLWEQDEAGKAAEDATKKHKAAVDALNEAIERSVQTTEDRVRSQFIEAELERTATIAIRQKTQALLDHAKVLADIARRNADNGDVSDEGAALVAEADVRRLTGLLKENQKELDKLTQNTTSARGLYQAQIIRDSATPEGRISRKYDALEAAATKAGDVREIARLTAARAAELKAIKDAETALRSSGKSRDAEAATVSQVSKVLLTAFGGSITSGKRSAEHNAEVGGAAGSYHVKGQAVDFVPAGGMGSVTKAQIRAAVESAGLTVKELLGPGDKGHSDHFHLAWSGGKSEIDSDRIKAQLEARVQQAAAALDSALMSVVQRYDEARGASIEYGNSIKQIHDLMSLGAITEAQAAQYGMAAGRALEIAQAATQQKLLDSIHDDLSGALTPNKDYEQWVSDREKAQVQAAEQMAYYLDVGANAIADVFGHDLAGIFNRMAGLSGADSGLSALQAGIGLGSDSFLKDFSRDISSTLEAVFGKDRLSIIGKGIGEVLGSAQVGGALGGALFGGTSGKLGGALGGVLGKEAGKELAAGALGKALGKFSSVLGPLGSIAGGILGGALGSLFGSTKKGSATIGANASGDLVITGYSGNSDSRKEASGKGANSAIATLENIAEALGGTINAANGSVSIGIRKGNYRVDTAGQGRTKMKSGVYDFGDDAEAAVRFATMNLIQDGVIVGLRDSTQRLLQLGADLDTALQKALDFESVFTRLKAYDDPVGAAIDTIDKEFTRLKNIFDEAGASTAEYADLERLYGIERAAAIKEAGEQTVASLKSLLSDLTVDNSALSLRTRQATAQTEYDALSDRVRAGDTSAYDDFATAAQTLLDIQRQISGSGVDYFDLLSEVTDITKTRIDAETNIASISAARPGLFGDTTSSASTSADAPVVSAIEQQTSYIAAAINGMSVATQKNLATLTAAVNDLNTRSIALEGSSNF